MNSRTTISDTSESDGFPLSNWKPFTLEDAYQDRPPLQFIVGNIFELPSVNIVYGAPGSFKSFLLADLAGAVAGGTDWLPPLLNPSEGGVPVTKSAVVWVDFDNGERRTLDRFKAIANVLSLPPDTPLSIYSMPSPTLDTTNDVHIAYLALLINDHYAKFVVIDNLGSISGNADENSADMVSVFSNLRWLSETTGAAIVIIHHRRKGTSNDRAGDALRGHSSIEGAIDLALLVARKQNALDVTVQSTKTRGADVDPFMAQFVPESDAEGNLIKAWFYGITDAKDNQTRQIMEAVRDALSDGPLNKGSLTTDVKDILERRAHSAGVQKIGDAIEDMHEQGFLTEEKGADNAKIYARNPEKPYE